MEETSTKPAHKTSTQNFYGPVASVLITIGLFFSAQIIVGFVFSMLVAGAGWSGSKASDWYQSSAFAQLLFLLMADVFILSAIAFLLQRKKYTFKKIGFRRPKPEDLWMALLGYGVYVLCFILITVIAKALVPSLNLEQEQFNFDAITKSPINLSFLFIALVILPPLIEEILCRGFLYTGLRSKLSYTPAAIITSIIFAAAHLQFGNGAPLLWVAAIDTFVLSLVLVYLREKTGRLAAPTMLHGLKNFIAFCLLFLIK